MSENLIANLQNYYKSKGISAMDFNCPHFFECSNTCADTFTTAKEAFVSSGYIKHELPRILFLSLDSGSADKDPQKKTLASVQYQEEIKTNVFTLPKNKHWYRTHEMAFVILSAFRPGMTIDEAKGYFAHTNSAKCCMNNPQRAQANSILFSNCREFIPGEIEILLPEILITQGSYASTAIQGSFPYLDMKNFLQKTGEWPEEIRIINIAQRSTIWIHTFHPRNPNYKRNRDNYSLYKEIAYQFIAHSINK
jgi:hypothetical protein